MSTTTAPIPIRLPPPPVPPEIQAMRQQAAEADRRREIRRRELYRRRMWSGTIAGAVAAVLLDRFYAGGHGFWLLGNAAFGAAIMAVIVHWRLGHLWGIALFTFGMLPWLVVSHGVSSIGVPVLLFVYALTGALLALWLDENRSVER